MDFVIELRCEKCGVQAIKVQDMTREMANDLAGMLDGTSPMYVHTPRDDPHSLLAHCVTCRGVFDAVVVDGGHA